MQPSFTRKPSQWGDPGTYSYKPVQTGRAFDIEISNQLNDQNRHYVHGGNTMSWSSRISQRKDKGYADAEMLVDNITDKYGNIMEIIKIIAHSMGGAYGKV